LLHLTQDFTVLHMLLAMAVDEELLDDAEECTFLVMEDEELSRPTFSQHHKLLFHDFN
jgi:hypothetical protein